MPSIADLDLLSAALDDALSAEDRAALTARLAAEPDLAAELNALRAYRELIKQAPTVLPPRDFRLDPTRFRRSLPWWMRFGAFEVTGAVGAAAAILMIALGVLVGGGSPANAPAVGESSIAVVPTSLISSTIVATENVTTDALLPTLMPTQLATASSANNASDGAAMIMPSATSTTPAIDAQAAPAAGQPIQPAATSGAAGGQLFAATLAPTSAALRAATSDSAPAESAIQPPPSATAVPIQAAIAATPRTDDNADPAVATTVTPEQLQDAASSTAEDVNAKAENRGVGTMASPTSAATSAITPAQPASSPVTPITPPPFLLIAGIALLVFSLVVFGLGRLRR